MKLTEFEKHYKTLHDHVEDLLITKAQEYAEETDRLSNFKQSTTLLDTNQARVAFAYCTKHYASLAKITADWDKGVEPSEELLLEKTGDILAYTYLIYACLMELKTPSETHVEASNSDDKTENDIYNTVKKETYPATKKSFTVYDDIAPESDRE